MMKRMYYLEICDSDKICGGVYPLGEMTEKQALKEAERRIKELWRSDKENLKRIEFNVCNDCEALDMVFSIDLMHGDITVYDYRTEEFIKDTSADRIKRQLKKIDDGLAEMDRMYNALSGNHA
jgi:hypothetical protein